MIDRYKLVCLRAQVKNELQHLAMNQGITKKRKLWSNAGERVLRELPLRPWSSRRREDLFRIGEMLNGQLELLDQAVVEVAEKNDQARLLMTQIGRSRPGANRDSDRRIMAEVLAVSMVGGTNRVDRAAES